MLCRSSRTDYGLFARDVESPLTSGVFLRGTLCVSIENVGMEPDSGRSEVGQKEVIDERFRG